MHESDKIFEELMSAELTDNMLDRFVEESKLESQPGYFDTASELAKDDD